MALSPDEIKERNAARMREKRRAAGAKVRVKIASAEDRRQRNKEAQQRRRDKLKTGNSSASRTPNAIADSSTDIFESVPLGIKVTADTFNAIKPIPGLLAGLPVELIDSIRADIEKRVADHAADLAELEQELAKPVAPSGQGNTVAADCPVEVDGIRANPNAKYPLKSIAAKKRNRRIWLDDTEDRQARDAEREQRKAEAWKARKDQQAAIRAKIAAKKAEQAKVIEGEQVEAQAPVEVEKVEAAPAEAQAPVDSEQVDADALIADVAAEIEAAQAERRARDRAMSNPEQTVREIAAENQRREIFKLAGL